VEITRPIWPPFYATALFLPRVYVSVTNQSETINRASLSAYVAEYDGPIGAAPTYEEGWDITYNEHWDRWKPGKKRKVVVRVRGRNLPRAGTYILRLDVSSWRPQDSPVQELTRALAKVEDMDDETKKRGVEVAIEKMRELGLDPHARRADAFNVEQIFKGTVTDYFRVEDMSSVLTFFLVVGTMLTAAATLIVGVAALA
jgi:hypothetical protein